jgi:hypothetical protein
VDDWFDSARDLLQQEEESSKGEVDFEPLDLSLVGEATSFEDAIEIIRWYQHQIYMKLMRAVRGHLEEGSGVLDEFTKDSDGSAKVALIAMDRSIAAWGEIRKHFPLFGDGITKILTHLARLRKKVEVAFPDARAFIRPGFDKIDLNS